MKKPLILLAGLAGAFYFRQQKQKSVPHEAVDLLGNYALVTGASTGIGQSIALKLAQEGMTVFATVRKESDADHLQSLHDNLEPLIMDVTDLAQIEAAAEVVKDQLGNTPLSVLVNNAGVAVPGPVEKLPMDELRWQFDVNVFGVVDVTQAFLPLMKQGSVIVNISSVAGRSTQPFLGAYSASKHALEALSDALRRELLLTHTGIDVVVIQPGSIKTPIWDKAKEVDLGVYDGTPYGPLGHKIKKMMLKEGELGAPPEAVAQTVLDIVLRRKNNPRYVVSQQMMKEVIVPRALPAKAIDKLVQKVLS